MSIDDYERIANETAGPDASEALRYMAEALHRGESMHTHAEIQQDVCSYCWLRAGRAMRAAREFSGHPYFAGQHSAATGGTVDGIRPHRPVTPEQDAQMKQAAEQLEKDNPITPERAVGMLYGQSATTPTATGGE